MNYPELNSYDELKDNYQFKVIKKILKMDFPFITDVGFDESIDINQYRLVPLKVYFNPYILQQETEWPFRRYAEAYLSGRVEDKASFMSLYYKASYNEAQELSDEIQDKVNDVNNSPAIPKELKLPKNRFFAVITYKMDINSPMPQDYEPLFES